MYTWRSAAAPAAAPVHMENTTTSTSTPPETAMMEEDPVIHDLCVHFQEAMIITAKSVDQELDALCHSFCSMTLKDKNQAQPEDDDQQQHIHDDEPSNQVFNHVATSATAAIMTTTTSATMELDDPMMEALCVQMQSLSIHHVFKPIQKKRSSAVYDDEDNNNVCPIPTKRQRLY